jgi:flagellar motor switch protein FliG
VKSQVFVEFFEMAEAKRFVAEGGIELAKELLEKSFGAQRAS